MEAEWFVGPIMEKLINTGFQYLKGQCRWQTGMKKELERLRDIHPKIKAVDFASSRAQIRDQNPDFNNWLRQLRDAIDEADDVLDEFEYMNHKRQLTRNKKQRKVRSIMKSIKKRLVKIVKRALQIDPNLKRLEEVVKKLDEVSAGIGNFLHLLEITEREQQEQLQKFYQTRETGSLPKNDLIGRDEDKEFVIQWLKKPLNEHQTTFYNKISLLSIVGQGGMGKTTLLQHVYNEMTKEFDLKIWVFVSNNFDAKKVIADMLEYLKKKRPRAESLGTLQESLKTEVVTKKFLLVLDDIWEEEEEKDKSKWKNVLTPLAYGSLGSKILITTRMYSVASMIAKLMIKKEEETILRLEGLKEDKCLQLLNSYAFANVENSDYYKHLRSIAGQIVKKLLGSPLAAKVIGGVLNASLDKRHWLNILNSDIVRAEPGRNILWSILRLSYIFLPKHLQICFAFCCIFPQDYEFDKDDLVRMWIALGFIQSSYNQEEAIEDIGRRYFDALVNKSLFEKFQIDSETHYKMHDLLHELAQSVSAQECFRVMTNEELHFKIPNTIRHLYVKTENLEMIKKIKKFKFLRSLFLTTYIHNKEIVDALANIFKSLRSIRLLYISAHDLKMIPEAIGNFIHLRYLKLFDAEVTQLPRSLSNLYHLQFIIYDSRNIFLSLPNDFLPREMNNLTNLYYLNLPWDYFPGMHGIGKLNSLQELNGFYVKNEAGYSIEELEHMNELRQLRIKHLENVKDAEQARNAKLCYKKNLTDLSLEWGGAIIYGREPIYYDVRGTSQNFVNIDSDERVLDNLQPHNNLKKLRMYSFMGIRPAIWMNNANLMSNLECIQIDKCLELQTLPPFGQLPFLKSLYLLDMPKVKRLDNKFHGSDKECAFPSLEVLHIKSLEALEDWFDTAAADDYLFPSLAELCLEGCPNLKELPYFPPKLKLLEMVNIGWKTLNCCSMSKSIPLETLEVRGCSNITYIPLADEIARLVALRSLIIIDCPSLISLGGYQKVETTEICQLILSDLNISDPSVLIMEALTSITSLLKLRIMDNDELVSFSNEVEQWFPQVSSSLCELDFIRLKSLQSLPSSLESLYSLKILRVINLPRLQLPPNIPASLKDLQLIDLKSLQCLPSSLSTISSLENLYLESIPLLQSLPDLPPSLCSLSLIQLKSLDCLPSCLPRLSSLEILDIDMVPRLRELPDLSTSLKFLYINNCHEELMERYGAMSRNSWH